MRNRSKNCCLHGRTCNKELIRLFKANERLRRKASKKDLRKVGKRCVPCCQSGLFYHGDVSTQLGGGTVIGPWALIDRFAPPGTGDRARICCCLKKQNRLLRKREKPFPADGNYIYQAKHEGEDILSAAATVRSLGDCKLCITVFSIPSPPVFAPLFAYSLVAQIDGNGNGKVTELKKSNSVLPDLDSMSVTDDSITFLGAGASGSIKLDRIPFSAATVGNFSQSDLANSMPDDDNNCFDVQTFTGSSFQSGPLGVATLGTEIVNTSIKGSTYTLLLQGGLSWPIFFGLDTENRSWIVIVGFIDSQGSSLNQLAGTLPCTDCFFAAVGTST